MARMIKRLVFAVLVLWALIDSVLTFRAWHELSIWYRLLGLLGSLFVSSLFIGVAYVTWDWLARKLSGAFSARS